MSLQVWLPLNGDTSNQGVSSAVFKAGSATVNSSGKIGKCYNFASTSSTGMELNSGISSSDFMTNYINNKSWTLCAWIKSASTDTCVMSLTYGLRLFAGTTPYVTLYNSSRTVNCSCSTSTTDGNWHHIAASYNVSTNAIKIYIDGVLRNTASYTSGYTYASSWTNNIYIGRDPNNNTASAHYFYQGNMNDVRIYDHTLSDKEVKEISKGLVVSYPLCDKYIEATTNINSYISQGISDTCYNGATCKYNYGTTTDMYKTTGTFEGRPCTKVYMGTAGASAYPYIFFTPLHPANGAYKTLSFDYFPTIGSTVNFYTYNGSATTTYRVNGGPITSGTTIPVNINQWNHIEFTLYGTSSSTSGWGYMQTVSHTSTTSNYWLFSNVQIEDKDHATGYTSSSRAAQPEYDASGYKGNATPVGTFTVITGSARNDLAVKFTSSNIGTSTSTGASYLKGTLTSQVINPTALTISWWANMINWSYQNSGVMSLSNDSSSPSDYTSGTLNQYDSGFRFNNSSGTGGTISATSIISNNAWHHYALVFNGSACLGYRDGTLITSTNLSGPLASFRYIYLGLSVAGGAWRQTSGIWSDFRIYSTALSASDIQDMYKAPISIGNTGTILTQGEIFEE